MWAILDHAGSVSSILGALLACYILWREVRISREVHVLRAEEATRHQKEGRDEKGKIIR